MTRLLALAVTLLLCLCSPLAHAKRLVFTAFGGVPERQRNIETFSQLYPAPEWGCIVFLFKPELNLFSFTHFAPHCTLIPRKGHVVELYKLFLARSNYSGVVFHGSDLSVDPDYDPDVVFEWMAAHDLHVASPLIPGSVWKCMNTPLEQRVPTSGLPLGSYWGRIVDFIEIGQVTFFDRAGWACWWAMLDTAVNTIGFGYDVCFYSLCRMRMGVIDNVVARHNVGNVHATQHPDEAMAQERAWKAAREHNKTHFAAPCSPRPDGGYPDGPPQQSLVALLPPWRRPPRPPPLVCRPGRGGGGRGGGDASRWWG